MTKTINLSRIDFISIGIFLTIIMTSFAITQSANASITSQLSFGSRGSQVTELQQFLATNSIIYPEKIVSGYFGPLTKNAVLQFQAVYDIPQVGTVGPMTRSKINNIQSSGLGLDINAPAMSNISLQANRNSATVNWTTNEPARGQLYYDTTPVQLNEATKYGERPYISGILATNTNEHVYSHSIMIQNLQPNTLYYYVTRSIDDSGNISITLPNTFRTTQ